MARWVLVCVGGGLTGTQALDGPAIRMTILEGMLARSKLRAPALPENLDFDAIIADYLPAQQASPTKAPIPPPPSKPSGDWLDGLV
jgi:hypothetical protein